MARRWRATGTDMARRRAHPPRDELESCADAENQCTSPTWRGEIQDSDGGAPEEEEEERGAARRRPSSPSPSLRKPSRPRPSEPRSSEYVKTRSTTVTTPTGSHRPQSSREWGRRLLNRRISIGATAGLNGPEQPLRGGGQPPVATPVARRGAGCRSAAAARGASERREGRADGGEQQQRAQQVSLCGGEDGADARDVERDAGDEAADGGARRCRREGRSGGALDGRRQVARPVGGGARGARGEDGEECEGDEVVRLEKLVRLPEARRLLAHVGRQQRAGERRERSHQLLGERLARGGAPPLLEEQLERVEEKLEREGALPQRIVPARGAVLAQQQVREQREQVHRAHQTHPGREGGGDGECHVEDGRVEGRDGAEERAHAA
mmetsp:Transcript_33746/g.108561  ORF Transcript_33746/g.108561 Transcript_33746/m.108561 type:complete len:382 (-) Transcript_33746:1783-2928(-)